MARQFDWQYYIKQFFRLIAFSSLLICYSFSVFARGGGGHSFGEGGYSSGGGHSYGGGGGGSGIIGSIIGDLIFWIFRLHFTNPFIAIFFDGVILFAFLTTRKGLDSSNIYNGDATSQKPREASRAVYINLALDRFCLNYDDLFSQTIFLDFVYALYTHVHKARGANQLNHFGGYLNTSVIQQLNLINPKVQAVSDVIVGACCIEALDIKDNATVRITVSFEACYTEESNGTKNSWYSKDRWIFSRSLNIKSKAPEKVNAIGCPACGAPLQKFIGNKCESCGQVIQIGEFDWSVVQIFSTRNRRAPILTSMDPEIGTEYPTIKDPDLNDNILLIRETFPKFESEFLFKVKETFMNIQAAWSELKWQKARPYESERVFQTHLFWIQEYQKQKLRNSLSKVQIQKIELVKVKGDHFYLSCTVRIFASMIDIIQDEQSKLIAGNPKVPRHFSEYWTFIRSRKAVGNTKGEKNCPNCGSPLKINITGNCDYCQSKVTSGEFDWILSRIEQDEVYSG